MFGKRIKSNFIKIIRKINSDIKSVTIPGFDMDVPLP
jgi:hypothetical protein